MANHALDRKPGHNTKAAPWYFSSVTKNVEGRA